MRSRILLVLLLLTVNLFAVEGKMRVKLQSHENVYTSQKVIISVELLTDAFSISDARITFPSSSKYIVNAPKSAAYIRTESINGTDWQVVHYEYEVYALMAGEIEVSSVKSTFSASMGYGQPKKEFALESKALHFSVLSPKGIKKDQFVLVTDKYSLTQKVEPQKSELIIGDAIEVEIIQKAHGVPDILLKPIHYKSTPLLRVYDKEPVLKNGLKGKFDVSRTDKFTFVATAEGNITIPAQSIWWFNAKTETVNEEKVEAFSFEIKPDPQIAMDTQKARKQTLLMRTGVIVLILLLLYYLSSPYVKRYLHERQSAYLLSEKGRFERLLKSVEEGDMAKIYRDFYTWINVLHPEMKVNTFKDIYIQYPEFKENFLRFESTLVSPNDLDKVKCTSTLESLRKIFSEAYGEVSYTLEKKLNP
jgi:hypothetical protein